MKKFAGMSYVRQKNGRFFDFKNLLHVWICYFKLCELLGIYALNRNVIVKMLKPSLGNPKGGINEGVFDYE